MRAILDQDTLLKLDDAQVDPQIAKRDTGNFLFLNLETLDTKFRIPPNERRRVDRERFRKALHGELKEHIHWGKKLSDIEDLPGDSGIRARFSDGTAAEGVMVIGAEGSNSKTRQLIAPETYRNQPIPVRFLGVAVDMTPAQVKPLRDIDPLLFQGCHPTTGTFMWVSMISTPESNGSLNTDRERFVVQINLSWLKKDTDDSTEKLTTDEERVGEMYKRSEGFHPLLKAVVHGIPLSTPCVDVGIQDWPCLEWDNHHGRITLVGDAAHAMTMYRGEAANHGILDASHLTKALADAKTGSRSLADAITGYEDEMRERTRSAVLLSREACLDAHDFHGLNENSAVLKRRALK